MFVKINFYNFNNNTLKYIYLYIRAIYMKHFVE